MESIRLDRDLKVEKVQKNVEPLKRMLRAGGLPTYAEKIDNGSVFWNLSDTAECFSAVSSFAVTNYSAQNPRATEIINPYLRLLYELKKLEVSLEYNVSEKIVYHGTPRLNVDAICNNNFDYRRHGQSKGIKFGRGVSFSPDAFYASHFCKDTFGHCMFKVRIMFVRSHVGNQWTVVPLSGCDSTENGKGSVIVKYDDDVFYPEHLINFTQPPYVKRKPFVRRYMHFDEFHGIFDDLSD